LYFMEFSNLDFQHKIIIFPRHKFFSFNTIMPP
jgi:hypothetical protein